MFLSYFDFSWVLSVSQHWWVDVKVWSQLGQSEHWSMLESSPCSLGWSQRLISERLQFPSVCWIRYFGDDCASTRTFRGGTLSILIFLVIWPPSWLFGSKCADSDADGKHKLSEKGWVGSLWAECWGDSKTAVAPRAQILSEWDWVGSTWSGCSTEEALNFLFSRNCCLLLASLFRVLGVLCLTWLGVRAGVIFLFPLLSKEQEKDPEVRWKLKPICWLTSVWMKARHCDSRDGFSFPITWGGAILVEWSRRDFRRAHAGLRVRSQLRRSCHSFFHHYQGSIDFNTVNINRTVGMYFLVSTGNRGDIEWHDLQRSYYPIHSLLPGVYVSILSLGTVFPRTLPMANIRNTSSRGKHWQCSSNDADKLNVDICRQAKRHYIGCTI